MGRGIESARGAKHWRVWKCVMDTREVTLLSVCLCRGLANFCNNMFLEMHGAERFLRNATTRRKGGALCLHTCAGHVLVWAQHFGGKKVPEREGVVLFPTPKETYACMVFKE